MSFEAQSVRWTWCRVWDVGRSFVLRLPLPRKSLRFSDLGGRHVSMILTEDGQLGVRGLCDLNDLNPDVRYAMECIDCFPPYDVSLVAGRKGRER